MPDEDKSPGLDKPAASERPRRSPGLDRELAELAARPLLDVPDYVHRTHTLCEILRTVAFLCLVLGFLISLSSRQGE